MEGGSVISSFCSPKTHLPFNLCNSASPSPPSPRHSVIINFQPRPLKCHVSSSSSRISPPLSQPRAVAEAVEQAAGTSPSSSKGGVSHRIDKSGRFCNPRAARELALLIAYAACLEGSDPVRLFDKRVNAKRDPGYVFDKAALSQYDHMSFGGAPVEAGTEEEAEELMLKNEKDSANGSCQLHSLVFLCVSEAEVLSAPLKLVYNKFVLRLTREILGAVGDRWNEHVLIIDKVIPPNWKDEPAARILELCILHLAMAEITVIGTRHQIVINEAVDLTKRFCDGCAPRIINGCLRTFVKDHSTVDAARPLESSKS